MKIIIAPARTMTIDTDSFACQGMPVFLDRAGQILNWLRTLNYDQLHRLWWNCSKRLADKNYQWLQKMDLTTNLTPAVMAFTGLQYQHMAPGVMTDDALAYLQRHLRILSGFYGLLRPFDGIVPYRLGMGDRARVAGSKNLYEFWGSMLADKLYSDEQLVLDLASAEYDKAIRPYVSGNRRLVKCVFGKLDNGRVRQLATRAKMARGSMVRYLANHQVTDLAGVKEFEIGGFQYSPDYSETDRLVFIQNH